MHKPIYVTLDFKIMHVNICMDLCKQIFYVKAAARKWGQPRVKGDVQALGYMLLTGYFYNLLLENNSNGEASNNKCTKTHIYISMKE